MIAKTETKLKHKSVKRPLTKREIEAIKEAGNPVDALLATIRALMGPDEYEAADKIYPTRLSIPRDQAETIVRHYMEADKEQAAQICLLWMNSGPSTYNAN